MRRFFSKFFKNIPRNNGYEDIVSSRLNSSKIIIYSNSEKNNFDCKKIDTSKRISETEAMRNIQLFISDSFTDELKSYNSSLSDHDFKAIIEQSRIGGQQKAWSQEFQRGSADLLAKYVERISTLVKNNKDLKVVFEELNRDLTKTKTDKKTFLKKLVNGLNNKGVAISDILKDNLRDISKASGYTSRVSEGRKFCLGAGKNTKTR